MSILRLLSMVRPPVHLGLRVRTAGLLRRWAEALHSSSPPHRAARYQIVVDACRSSRVSHILEIGTSTGGTAMSMILAVQSVGDPNRVEYWGFDLFEEFEPQAFAPGETKPPKPSAEVERNLRRTTGIGRDRLHLIVGDTRKTLREWVPNMPPMDVIFIDGGHSEEVVRKDWKWCQQLMHAGTRCFFDDYTPRPNYGVIATVRDIANSGVYGVRVHDVPADEFDGYIHRIAEVWLAFPLVGSSGPP